MKLTDTNDPMVLLESDRTLARDASDPMVDRCVLGTVNRDGRANLRVLVLREFEDRLGIFYSNTSTKHLELLRSNNEATVLIFLPSQGVQYRISANLVEIPREIIAEHWQLKPNAAKRMDSVYERRPQSTMIDDFDAFELLYSATVPSVTAPKNAYGCYLEANEVERLQLRSDPDFHVRQLFTKRSNEWAVKPMVP